MVKEKYQEQLNEYSNLQKICDKEYNKVSSYRMISFIGLVVTLIIGLVDSNLLCVILSIIFFIGFILLVVKHKKISDKQVYTTSRVNVLNRHLSRFDDGWKLLNDNGAEYIKKDDTLSKDLDLLGDSSLYQYLCCANCAEGKDKLAKYLLNTDKSIDEISNRQKAINEIAMDEDFCINFETISLGTNTDKTVKKNTGSDFIKYCIDSKRISSIYLVTAVFFTIIMVVLCVLSAFRLVSILSIGFCFIAELAVIWLTAFKTSVIFNPIFNFTRKMESISSLLQLVISHEYESDYMKKIKDEVLETKNPVKALKKLNTIGELVNVRFNPAIHMLLCGTVMWDFYCVYAVDRWKKEYGAQIEKWINVVAEMEALISLSMIQRTNQNSVIPELRKSEIPEVYISEGTHPLINQDKVVANSIKLKGDTVIITGSNMSGKTTFLRTIGVNLVLAYAGASVCANSLVASPMKIFTSMRVNDDVSNGISTFYAEILRIKDMVEFNKSKKPMISLIDEIFKGTNSADRIVGAKGVITKLSSKHCITMVSTHDFELCDLENSTDAKFKNYHFSEYYKDDKLLFDYKMKDGRCKTTNARQIMRMAGLE